MKTTKVISMAEFAKEVEKICIDKQRPCYRVDCEMMHHLSKGDQKDIEFNCYIDGYSFFRAKTPNGALALLKEAVYPKKSIVEDVLV